MKLKILGMRRRPDTCLLLDRALSFMESCLARIEAQRADADVRLFLDMGGQAAEADGGNFFVVGKGELITPPPAGVTPGITHEVVVEIGAELGIPVLEENLNTRHVHGADEAPLSSTCGGMVLVESIDGNRMRTGAPGPVTTEPQREYRRMVTS